MELRRDILQKKRDTVRFVGFGGARDDTGPAREQPKQIEFRRIGDSAERRLRQRRVTQRRFQF